MNKKLVILFFGCSFAVPVFLLAQSDSPVVIKGTIMDVNGNAIPYVNVGIVGKDAGTVSDSRGEFKLTTDHRFLADSVQFSCIGYHPKTYQVGDLTKIPLSMHRVVLVSRFRELKEVVVTPKQWRVRILGNTTRSKLMSGGFSSNDLGAEAGTRIKIKNGTAYLDKISFHLSYNKLDSIKIRVNVYSMKNGKPFENILPQNIIVNLGNKQVGNIEVDVSKYDLVVEGDVLIALQMIEGKGDVRSSVFMSASLLGAPTYYREASHATWKIYKGLSIGINATVRQ